VLILKINFKKYYFDIFSSEKHFEKQSLPQYQTVGNPMEISGIAVIPETRF